MKRIVLFIWLLLLAPMLAYADGIGLLNSEVDGNPNGVYAYKIVWPNGSTSITGGVLTITFGGGAGDFLADGSVPMTGTPIPNAANTIPLGSATYEWSDLYLGDGAVIYGQNDQSNTLTSSATGWVANKPISAPKAITTHSATEAVLAATLYGDVHLVTGNYTLTLPTSVAGMSAKFCSTTAAVFYIDTAAGDKWILAGTATDDGDKIGSPGSAGDCVDFVSHDATVGWMTMFMNVVFVDSGA